jgi:hypothetical protein
MFTFSDCRLRQRRPEIDCANVATAHAGRANPQEDLNRINEAFFGTQSLLRIAEQSR